MNPALLFPLLLAADSVGIESAALREAPPVQLWISNDQRFLPGERAKVQVEIEDDSYLLVLQVDPEGYLRVLFPLDPDKDNFARGGKKYEVKGRGGREAFEAGVKGQGVVYAAVSREPFHFDDFVVGGHWDYKALSPSRLSTNPESELNDLVRRMAQSDFDYDIMNYEVVERSTYASEYYPQSSGYADSWCCGQSYFYGSPFSLSLSFGYPYRHYYYDPYYYAYYPFYNPFYYTPYYYAPVYYPSYVYPRPYYYSPYGRGYYPYGNGNYRNRYQGYGQVFPPYRFRGGQGFGGYRGRGNGFQGVGGVYHPGKGFQGVGGVYHPVHFPVHEPPIARPVRHIPDRPADPLPNGVAKRSLIDDDRRVQSRPVEAHRARPGDRDDRSAGEPRLVRREVEARRSGDNRSGDSPRGNTADDRGSDARRQSGGRPADRSSPESRPSGSGRAGPPPSSGSRAGGGQPRMSGGHPQGGGAPQGGGQSSSDGGRRHR
jgi:hypothetical protein